MGTSATNRGDSVAPRKALGKHSAGRAENAGPIPTARFAQCAMGRGTPRMDEAQNSRWRSATGPGPKPRVLGELGKDAHGPPRLGGALGVLVRARGHVVHRCEAGCTRPRSGRAAR